MDKCFTYLQFNCSFLFQLLICLIGFSTFLSCVSIENFTDQQSPIWTGGYHSSDDSDVKNRIKVVSYNIKFAKEIDKAVLAFKEEAELKNANIILLQEMDTIGTMQIAEALHMNYVYVPAVRHGKDMEYFGNSILSKWPISTVEKIILPHRARSSRQRIGVYAIIDINGKNFHVYNIHLATMALKRRKRVEQLAEILKHAEAISEEEPVIIAGDFNSFFPKDRQLFAQLMDENGFTWYTKDLKFTAKALKGILRPQIDQCFGRAVTLNQIGVSTQVEASDHFPIYFNIVFNE